MTKPPFFIARNEIFCFLGTISKIKIIIEVDIIAEKFKEKDTKEVLR